MAETGQAGTQAPQSMHSTGSMNSWSASPWPASSFLGWMQSTGQASTQAVSLVPIQGSAITYAIVQFSGKYLLDADSSTGHRRQETTLVRAVLLCGNREIGAKAPIETRRARTHGQDARSGPSHQVLLFRQPTQPALEWGTDPGPRTCLRTKPAALREYRRWSRVFRGCRHDIDALRSPAPGRPLLLSAGCQRRCPRGSG